jgi:hypothetical protein
MLPKKWDDDGRSGKRDTTRMKKHTQDLIAEVPRRSSRVKMTIGIDLGDVWSHYCTLNEEGEVVVIGCARFIHDDLTLEKAELTHSLRELRLIAKSSCECDPTSMIRAVGQRANLRRDRI